MAPPRVLYQINLITWLDELSSRLRRSVNLGTVPARCWAEIADLGADAVWLMGAWERSPIAAHIARTHPDFAGDRSALPGLTDEDVCGSAYAVCSWHVDPRFGGDAALAKARVAMARHGLGLWLDWIPNHVAPEHPFTRWAMPGGEGVASIEVDGCRMANGRDPFFPAWPDTVQLDLNLPGLRIAAGTELARIATMCDGVRCDMAMLALPDVFARTWEGRASPDLQRPYWPDVLETARRFATGFGTIAEAYWGRETELLHQGFDAAYDKTLYDALRDGDAAAVRHAVSGSPCTVRFLENHDEKRAVVAFPAARLRCAEAVVATLPGTWLVHAGQEHGHRQRVPVTLARGGREGVDRETRAYLRSLIRLRRQPAMSGAWSWQEASGWPDNQSCRNLLAWSWKGGDQRLLTVVNWSDRRSQAVIRLDWGTGRLVLSEVRDGSTLERDGAELSRSGLYVDLPAWGSHILTSERP